MHVVDFSQIYAIIISFFYKAERMVILMDKELLNEINTAYYRLEMKQAEIIHALSHRIFELESGWYNGHYSHDAP